MQKDTQQLILDTARKHFVQKGYAGARTQEIADEAGINKALLHYYYRTKEQLFHEITVNILSTIIPEFTKAIDIEGDIWVKLDAMVGKYISTLMEHPDIPFFIMSEISQQREGFIEELKKRSENFQPLFLFAMQFQEEMEKGNIRPFSPPQLFLNIMGMTVFPFIAKPIFTTVWSMSDEGFTELMSERKEAILDFIKHSLVLDKSSLS